MSAITLKQQLKKKCIDALLDSTFHGASKIFLSEKLIQKLFWTTITLAMYAYFSASVANNVLEYLKYPVVTNINTVYEKEVTFPAVNFCYGEILGCSFKNVACQLIPRASCFTFNSGLNVSLYPISLLRSTIPGVINGLKLTLRPNVGSYVYLMIYNQSADFDWNKAIRVSRGIELDVAISRVFSSKLSAPYSNCKKEYIFEPKPLDILNQTSFPYFQSDCFFLCEYQHQMEVCNRTAEFNSNFQYYFTNKNHFFRSFYSVVFNECNQKNPSLVNSIFEKFDSIGANTICDKQCPIECDSISYSISMNSFLNNQNYSRINIYYEDFFYTAITEEPKASIDSLIGTIGGLLGLFLGASLTSFFEIIDLIFSLLSIIFEYKKIKPSETFLTRSSTNVIKVNTR
jgi:hypothetical protein